MSYEVRNTLIMAFGGVLAMLALIGGVVWIDYATRVECDSGYVWYHTSDFEGCITLDDAMHLQSKEG